MPKKHSTDTPRVLAKIAAQTLTINPKLAIDRDLTLRFVHEELEDEIWRRKDRGAGIVKNYHLGEFYVENEITGTSYAVQGESIRDVFRLLRRREIEIEWADFRRSLSTRRLQVGGLDDAQYVVRSEYFTDAILCREGEQWLTLLKDGSIKPVAEDELQKWLFGYNGGMSLVVFRNERQLYQFEYSDSHHQSDDDEGTID